jgi:hypothetical protein
MGKTCYMVWVYIAWAIGLISYIRVLRQRSYVDVAPFPTGNLECGRNPRLIPIACSYIAIVVVLA